MLPLTSRSTAQLLDRAAMADEGLEDPITRPWAQLLALFLVLCFGHYISRRFVSHASYSKIARIGQTPKGSFDLARERNNFMKNGRKLVEEGYAKAGAWYEFKELS